MEIRVVGTRRRGYRCRAVKDPRLPSQRQWIFGGGNCLIGLTHPPSNFWIAFIFMCVIGSYSSEKDLKATFYYSSVGFE